MLSREEQLAREQRWMRPVAWLSIALAATGFITLLPEPWPFVWDFLALVHAVLGVAVGLVLVPYLLRHVLRTARVQRPLVLLSGVASMALAIALCASGLDILLRGQSERLRWVYSTHLWTAFAITILFAWHLQGHLAARRDAPLLDRIRTLRRTDLGYGLIVLAIALLLAGGFGAAFNSYRANRPPRVVDGYQLPYGDAPFAPSQTRTTSGGFVHPDEIGNSEECRRCHQDIDRMWRSSMHGQAASDPVYERNIQLLVDDLGIAATRYCEGCHAPVALLTGDLSEGGIHGGVDGSLANDEGISCVTCHRMSSIVHLKGVASYEFAPAEGYPFAGSRIPVLQWVHDLLLEMRPQKHRGEMALTTLESPKLCATCHAQFMDKDMNDWGWVQMQDEYAAWLESPFSGQDEHRVGGGRRTRCQDCHFPLIAAEDPSANEDGLVVSHYSLGGNTAIPHVLGDAEQVARTEQFLAGRIQLSIVQPNAIASAEREVESSRDIAMEVIVSNVGVGHDFPGGTIDINEAWIELVAIDASGVSLLASGLLAKNGDVDPSAHFYRSIPVNREGQHVWRHDLFNVIGESYRRVVKSGEIDLVEYRIPISTESVFPIRLDARLRYRKLANRYARWALEVEEPMLPIVDMARASLVIEEPVPRR